MESPLAIDNTLLLVQVDWVISLGKFESASWEVQLTHEAGLFPPGTAVRSGGGFWGGERDSIVVGWGWLCVVCACVDVGAWMGLWGGGHAASLRLSTF